MLSAVIRRPDRRSLGNPEQVKSHLSDEFPGLEFIYFEKPDGPPIALPFFSVVRLMLWLGRERYPHWYANMMADGFAVEFRFDAKPVVRAVNVTLYGAGAPSAEPYFARLSAKTGWQIEF